MGSAKTAFSFSTDALTRATADGLIIPVFKKPSSPANSKSKAAATADTLIWTDALKTLDKAMQGQLKAIMSDEKFDAGRGKVLSVRKAPGDKIGARRVVLVGMGETAKFAARHWEANILKGVSSVLSLKDAKSVAIQLPEGVLTAPVLIMEVVDAVYQATYRSMEAKEKGPDLNKVSLLLNKSADASMRTALNQGEVLAKARSQVKDLVNHPANLKSTNTLVNTAKGIAKSGIEVKVQSSTAWIEKNMPCFYTVAKGSVATDPPKFIRLHYAPKAGKANKKIAVVGKSVIFDTGGYQVKPGDSMVTMKGDMTGGAVTLAVMQALSELKPANIEVFGYLAATPNKIDSDAMIPDSIVNTTCGKKVEIRHTDAEGRLTLIDAVAKACEDKPAEIITIATLTGSASQAVGYYIALMGNNPELVNRIDQAGKLLGEPIQTLDVNEDDYDNIKSKLDGADLINTAQRRHRGAQSAAAFVMSGAPEAMPMAHLDIAGADMTADEKATGVSVKTILQYLLNENGQPARTTGTAGGSKPARKTSKATASKTAGRKASPAKTVSKAKTTAKKRKK